MKRLTAKQAFIRAERLPQRTRKYKHRAGQFVLTASFRSEVDMALVNLAGKLASVLTQHAIAELFGTSTSTIGKMVRIYYWNKENHNG